jgi:ABC-type branched-subunit amino acid transport system ATPase component
LNNLILEVNNVAVSFGGVRAVNGATLDVEVGSVTSVIGPNGAGKTTLFNLISGAIKPDSGTILFQGLEIQNLFPHKIADRGIIRTFQGAKVIKRLSVVDNLMLGGQDNPGDSLVNFFSPKARKAYEVQCRERAMELLKQIGIESLASEYAGILSGGQRKLLDLARALMANPILLLLDEPFAGVNPALVDKLLEVLHAIRSKHNLTFLLIEHNLETVMNISDRVIVMAEGRVIADGEPNSIYENQVVIDAYLGTRKASK